MSGNKFMKVTEIAEELGVSKITVEFWLKRFNKWLPHTLEKNKKLYSMKTFNKFLFIAERINAGMLPSEIEKSLKENFSKKSDNNLDVKNLRTDSVENLQKQLSDGDTAQLLQSFVTSFDSNQERIAKAHERRAEAEERKAIAIEKRAEAEEKKAIAMNNIANALQNMKHEVWPGNTENLIKSETAGAILLDETSTDELSDELFIDDSPSDDSLTDDSLTKDLSNDESGVEDSFSSDPERNEFSEESYIDDFHGEKQSDIDDLSLLVDIDADKEKTSQDSSAISSAVPFHDVHDTLDDLSLLLDPDEVNNSATSNTNIHDDLDDLSRLLDENEKTATEKDKNGKYESENEDETENNETGNNIDDLSLLIDDKPDDLSLLIDEKEKDNEDNMDNLALLIEDEAEKIQDNLKPSVTLKENFDQYKSEIINSIIKLKKEGLSVEETTTRLNNAGVITLSGKNRWGVKTIAKIYKFIESVS